MKKNMLTSNLSGVKLIYVLNFIFSLLYIIFFNISLFDLILVFILFMFMNSIGIAVMYHRFWTHKSFIFKYNFLKFALSIFPMVSGVGSILGWAGMHRRHHKFHDTTLDPHQAEKGLFNMLTMKSYFYEANAKEVIDLARDKFVVFTHKYYFCFPLIYSSFCFILFGFKGLVIGFCLPAFLSLLVQNLTNYVNHYNKQNFYPTNVSWINLFNFGDGWHNNHHNDQSNFTTSLTKNQIDTAGFFIKLVSK
jgi:stearoyl-CoA desaturase (delta-9 desaturase)